jgi:hypothetical protein
MGRENGMWMKVEENCIARQQVCVKIRPSINLTMSTNFTFVTPDETHQHGGFLSSAQYACVSCVHALLGSNEVRQSPSIIPSGCFY